MQNVLNQGNDPEGGIAWILPVETTSGSARVGEIWL